MRLAKNIAAILIVLVTVYACNSYENTVCTECNEKTLLFTTNSCGSEEDVSNLEWELAMAEDSMTYFETLKEGDSIITELLPDSTNYPKYYLIMDSTNSNGGFNDSIYDYVKIENDRFVALSDTNYVVVIPDGTDSVLYVYSDSLHIEYNTIFKTVYEFNLYGYKTPEIIGDTTRAVIDSSIILESSFHASLIDTLSLGDTLNFDETYLRLFQQNWECVRQ